MCRNSELEFETSPLLAMRPATVNWLESLAAPLPLFFHCSSLSLRIFILSASDIFAPTSTLLFYQEKAVPQLVMRLTEKSLLSRVMEQTISQEFINYWFQDGVDSFLEFYNFKLRPLTTGAIQCPFFFWWFTPAAIFHLNFTIRNTFAEHPYLFFHTGAQDLLQKLVIFLHSVF